MKFDLIRKAVIEQHNKRMPKITTEEELKKELDFKRKSYKGDFENQRKKLLSFIQKQIEKDKTKDLEFIKSVENAEPLRNPLIITVEWKKSRMWRMNPKAYTNYGFEGESIGGCGYCKLSTATAQALNSHLGILNILFKAEERRLKEGKAERRSFIGYGSGYFAIPRFEGGVGVESHRAIIEGLNLKWENITNTNNTDVYRISKD